MIYCNAIPLYILNFVDKYYVYMSVCTEKDLYAFTKILFL